MCHLLLHISPLTLKTQGAHSPFTQLSLSPFISSSTDSSQRHAGNELCHRFIIVQNWEVTKKSTRPTASTRKSQDGVFLNGAFFNESGGRPSSTAPFLSERIFDHSPPVTRRRPPRRRCGSGGLASRRRCLELHHGVAVENKGQGWDLPRCQRLAHVA
jgi:hypothetical protein